MPATSPLVSLAPAARRRDFPAICLAALCCWTSAADARPWFDEQGPTPAARQALALLSGAAADGLEARDYGVDQWQQSIDMAGGGSTLSEATVARLDDALNTAMRRYLADLHFGRVDPQALGAKYTPNAAGDFDPDALLSAALADDRLADAARSAAPRWPQYDRLRKSLADYRELAGNPAWQQELPPLPAGRLTPGQAYAGSAQLAQRLILLGDLAPGGAPSPRYERYEGKLVEGLKSFQQRHGLMPDGVIGKEAFAQLKVSPEVRAGQIELALERLRWTPLLPARRAVVVNVPEFMLYTYQLGEQGIEPGPVMRVIVGDARKTRTPLFDAEMRFIEFSPYWNIPPSITRGETLPRLRRDPGYFDRQGFELVTGDGRVIAGLPEGGIEALARGQMRIRQRPGAGNALGDIKFVFPNSENIYLHHTPTTQLFKRDRRDFSHGCIRVEAPADLARFVLADQPDWSKERIVQAMSKGKSTTVRLKETVPVVIAYSTAVVRDGRVHFFPDLYERDKLLRAALRERSAALRFASQASPASPRIAIDVKSAD